MKHCIELCEIARTWGKQSTSGFYKEWNSIHSKVISPCSAGDDLKVACAFHLNLNSPQISSRIFCIWVLTKTQLFKAFRIKVVLVTAEALFSRERKVNTSGCESSENKTLASSIWQQNLLAWSVSGEVLEYKSWKVNILKIGTCREQIGRWDDGKKTVYQGRLP